MIKTSMTVMLVSTLCGCALVVTEATPPETRSILSPLSLDETYLRAQQTAGSMGAVLLREDPQTQTCVYRYKAGLALHIRVTAGDAGTQLTVTASILPGHMGVGFIYEVDEFVRRYHKEPTYAHR